MTEVKTNRKYKNSVFTLLFSEKDKLLELYNAVSGANYPESTDIEIITLSDVLFMEQYNDIAFVLEDKLIVLIEHQSTVNDNMPLRMLQYMAREYQMITDRKDLYKERLIKIPTPEFIVLYNGKDEFPDFKELKLSDAFKSSKERYSLELLVQVYNINKGRNVEFVNKSPALSGYAELVAEVNKNLKTMSRGEAIKAAIKSCIERGNLLSFLKKHSSEVENMLLTEWNLKDALEVKQEEAETKAREELFALWESGVSLAEAKERFGVAGSQAASK